MVWRSGALSATQGKGTGRADIREVHLRICTVIFVKWPLFITICMYMINDHIYNSFYAIIQS